MFGNVLGIKVRPFIRYMYTAAEHLHWHVRPRERFATPTNFAWSFWRPGERKALLLVCRRQRGDFWAPCDRNVRESPPGCRREVSRTEVISVEPAPCGSSNECLQSGPCQLKWKGHMPTKDRLDDTLCRSSRATGVKPQEMAQAWRFAKRLKRLRSLKRVNLNFSNEQIKFS